MTFEELKAEAEKEAYLLHQTTSKEEKSKLKWAYFDPENPVACIYGLLTGHCYGERAAFLLSACAIPSDNLAESVESVFPVENTPGIFFRKDRDDGSRSRRQCFSLLEQYIIINRGTRKHTTLNREIFNIVKFGNPKGKQNHEK